MRSLSAWTCLAALALAAWACGGGSSGGGTPPPSTPPSAPSANPCAAINAEAPADEPRPATVEELAKREPRICRYQPMNVLEAVWKHRAARDRGVARAAGVAVSEDVGDVAVIQDAGDIMIPANAFDLGASALAFTRNGAGGYDVRQGDSAFRQALGRRVTLADDDSDAFEVPFGVPFFGRSFTSAFVNSDGNLTFEEADEASTDRSVTRYLSGPPRIALFFADLDPSSGGGVFVNTQSDFFSVTWCKVPAFEDSRTVTAQLVVSSDGRVEIKFADPTTLGDAVVGLSPGRTNTFSPVDLSRAVSGSIDGGSGAVGERFAAEEDIDLPALGERFYRTHADTYDQLVVWSDRDLITGAFAYETTVANDIRGIGSAVFNASSEFGSAGALHSIAFMDDIGKYPADPAARFTGENSTLGLIGHEVGHRWLVQLKFRDAAGVGSGAWLGRADVHWSFFMDSDASFVEGNEIQDLGGGSFKTGVGVERYSALDQYAMGLRREAEVPPVFFVESPTNVVPDRTRESAPRREVTFNGTRRDVLIQDVVAALGVRSPGAAESPRVHRQAFVYVIGAGTVLDRAAVEKIERFRREWEPFFSRATDGRMRVETRLRP